MNIAFYTRMANLTCSFLFKTGGFTGKIDIIFINSFYESQIWNKDGVKISKYAVHWISQFSSHGIKKKYKRFQQVLIHSR